MEKNEENKLHFEKCNNCSTESILIYKEYKICLSCGSNNKSSAYHNGYDFNGEWWIEKQYNPFIKKNLPFLTDSIVDELKISISNQFYEKGKSFPSLTIPCFDKNKEVINLLFFKFSKKYIINEKLKYMPNTEFIPLGLDKINNEKVYIVNTIKDYLTLYSIGIHSILYFPYFFDFKRDNEVFFKIKDYLNEVKKFIFVEDNTKELEEFSNEFSRRVGKEKCSKIKWSCIFEEDIVNAYNVYIKLNDENLKFQLQNEQPYPVLGIHELYDVDDEMEMFYENGIPLGKSLGYPSLDSYFRVSEGRMTIVTGIPGHGKTTLLNSFLIKLSELYGWVNAIYSPESQPLSRYFADIIQIKTNKIYANMENFCQTRSINEKKMRSLKGKFLSEKDKNETKKWVNEHFKLILPDEDTSANSDWSLDGLLELTRQAIYRYGVKCLVIDPWNEIEHDRKMGQSETEYISEALTKIKRFSRKYGIHVFVVAHPTKLNADYNTGLYQIPRPYDIAGGANWRNKADICLCVYRFTGEFDEQLVDLYIQKTRYKEDGKLGRVTFYSDKDTGFVFDKVDQLKRSKFLLEKFDGKEPAIKSEQEFLLSYEKTVRLEQDHVNDVDLNDL